MYEGRRKWYGECIRGGEKITYLCIRGGEKITYECIRGGEIVPRTNGCDFPPVAAIKVGGVDSIMAGIAPEDELSALGERHPYRSIHGLCLDHLEGSK